MQQQPTLAPAPHMGRAPAQDTSSDQALREQLLSHVNDPSQPQQQSRPYAGPALDAQLNSSPANHAHNIDPAIAGSGMMSNSPGESGGDENGADKKATKRELSTSKRAAQNRAAQRAFRQRKEGHIKRLEEQVRDYAHLSENYKAIQAENYQLRDYIINLQSRLIESQGDYPPAPSNINLQQPPSVPHGLPSAPPGVGLVGGTQVGHVAGDAVTGNGTNAPTAPMGGAAVSQLQASAAKAVEGMKSESAAAAAAVTDPALTNAGTGNATAATTKGA